MEHVLNHVVSNRRKLSIKYDFAVLFIDSYNVRYRCKLQNYQTSLMVFKMGYKYKQK